MRLESRRPECCLSHPPYFPEQTPYVSIGVSGALPHSHHEP